MQGEKTDTEEYWAFKNSRNKKVAREAQVQHCSCQFFCLCSVAFQESCLHCRACTPPEDLAAGSGHFGLAAGLTGLWVRCWAGGGEGKEAACVLSLETFELSSPSPAFCGKQACLSGSEENLCFVSSHSNITVSTGGCSLQANSLSCTWWLFLTSSGVVVLTPHPAGGMELNCGASRMAQTPSLHHKSEEAMAAASPSKPPFFTTLSFDFVRLVPYPIVCQDDLLGSCFYSIQSSCTRFSRVSVYVVFNLILPSACGKDWWHAKVSPKEHDSLLAI